MMASLSSSKLASSLQRLRTGGTFPPIEVVWASHSSWPLLNPNRSPPNHIHSAEKIHISVLDSSFNPPTLAHSALAKSPTSSSIRSSKTPNDNSHVDSDYDAKLLLLSVRNADKQLKPSDATYVQRLEMMIEFAKDLQDHDHTEISANIAVAIVDEPTFVGKSKLLREYLRKRLGECDQSSSMTPGVQLTFLLGYDTLERLFSPKYYNDSEERMFEALRGFFTPPRGSVTESDGEPDGDGSCVVCARRSPSSYSHMTIPTATHSPSSTSPISPNESPSQSLTKTISAFLVSSSLPSSCVTMIDIGEDVWNISSSEVRKGVQEDEGPVASSRWKNMVSERVKRYILEHRLYE